MAFPSEKKLKKMRELLEKAEPSRTLSKNATALERAKYKMCERFSLYILENKISQADLARRIDVDPSRINEIVKYKIDLFTLDKLVDYASRLDLDVHLEVA